MGMYNDRLRCVESKEGVKVLSKYWETLHSRERGGSLSSIIFRYGSGNNILSSPLNSSIRRKEGVEYIYYEESMYRNPEIKAVQEDGTVTITAKGWYISKTGKKLNVAYQRRYRYDRFGLVGVKLQMDFTEPVDWIIEIDIAGLSVLDSLNSACYRPAPESIPESSFFGHCIWHEFSNSHYYNARQMKIGRYLPLYLSMIRRGVEGIELFRGDDIENDGRVFTEGEEGQSYCDIQYNSDKNIISLRYEPYGNWTIPITVAAGKYDFSYYLGLPFPKGENRVHTPYFHVGINSQWPDEKQMDTYAEAGIKLIRLHNDYREDGPFWRDGYYPPYDNGNMKKMDWVIEQVHKRNMKIVPYFSLKELHPDCPEYKRYSEEWKRTTDKKLSVIHNYAGSGEFGAQMCLRSNWLDFRKKSIDMVLSNHNFDGIYYDWVVSLYCNNPLHLNGKRHTDIEELLDLIFWTRERVGPDGLVFLHLSGVPMMVIENTADLVYTHEELNNLSPMPGDFCPEVDFAGITGHQIVGSRAGNTDEERKKFLFSCFLQGLWTYPSITNIQKPALKMIKALTSYNISSYSFAPASKSPVQIDEKDIMAALYWKKGKVIIHIVNFGKQRKRCSFRVNLKEKGFSADKKVQIHYPDDSVVDSDVRKLAVEGGSLTLEPLECRFIEIDEV